MVVPNLLPVACFVVDGAFPPLVLYYRMISTVDRYRSIRTPIFYLPIVMRFFQIVTTGTPADTSERKALICTYYWQ